MSVAHANVLGGAAMTAPRAGGGVKPGTFLRKDRDHYARLGIDLVPACPNHMNSPLSYADPARVESVTVHSGITPVSVGGDSIGGSIQVKSAPPRFATPEQVARMLLDDVAEIGLATEALAAYEALLDRFPGLFLDTTMMLAGYFPVPDSPSAPYGPTDPGAPLDRDIATILVGNPDLLLDFRDRQDQVCGYVIADRHGHGAHDALLEIGCVWWCIREHSVSLP